MVSEGRLGPFFQNHFLFSTVSFKSLFRIFHKDQDTYLLLRVRRVLVLHYKTKNDLTALSRISFHLHCMFRHVSLLLTSALLPVGHSS